MLQTEKENNENINTNLSKTHLSQKVLYCFYISSSSRTYFSTKILKPIFEK